MALPDPFSIEEGAVCFSGRALKGADASTFEVLAGGAYARDKDAVYLVMQKKVKALKGPDPASFEALGGDYGRDASHVYFEGKRVRLKKGAGRREAFRWLGSCYGADGSWMYFGTQQCAPPEGVDLDWARLRHRPFTENKVNRSDAVLSDGVHHFFRLWRLGWVPVDGFEFDNVEPIETSEGYRGVHEYLGDGARVWCAGVLLEGADAARARVVGFNALDDGEAVYGGHHRLEFAPGSLAWVGDDLFRTEDALFSMNREGVPKEVAKLESAWEAPSVEFAFQALVDAIWPDAFHVLDR
ncbi:MAG: DKNYY domain-containing protein, partial [Planctomycetota bacterium]